MIYATSDIHGMLIPPAQVPECEVFIIAGDVTPVTDHSLEFQRRWLYTTFQPWLEAVGERVGTIVGIAGNHDFAFQTGIGYDLPWVYLEDEAVTIEGRKIYGTPWTPTFGIWAYMESEENLVERYQRIPSDVDILVSHGPPAGYCDRTMLGDHAGSTALHKQLLVAQPKTVVCGHIHEAFGVEELNHDGPTTTIYNVSMVNFMYRPVRYPVQIEVVNRKEEGGRRENLSHP